MRADGYGADNARPVMRAVGVEKLYQCGDQTIRALDGVNLTVHAGEFVSIMGTSGSGKSTLMNLIGGLDVPTTGRMELIGHNIAELAPNALAELRNTAIGYVFQQFNLLPRTTALSQVMLPLSYRRPPLDRSAAVARAQHCLSAVQLADRMEHFPSQLSGGQQQRVAIARALANAPQLILADEPTGALDSRTSREIMVLLSELNASGITVILVTHDPDIAAYARRVITFRDGRIVTDTGKLPEERAA